MASAMCSSVRSPFSVVACKPFPSQSSCRYSCQVQFVTDTSFRGERLLRHNCQSFFEWTKGSNLSVGTSRGFSITLPRRNDISAISTNDFKTGSTIEMDGAPYRVQEFLHVKPGKGSAFVRTKLKNYLTGNTVEKTFRAGEIVDDAVVVKELKQYTYSDGSSYVFMDMVTYDETQVSSKDMGDGEKWLKEGMECYILQWNGKVIGVDLPTSVELEVVETDPGLKGDTAGGGGTKPATVDTGAIVSVPLFINIGDRIIIDTRTGTYSSRA